MTARHTRDTVAIAEHGPLAQPSRALWYRHDVAGFAVRRVHGAREDLLMEAAGHAPRDPMLFDEVDFEDVGRCARPHFHRGPCFVFWVASPELAGIFPTAPSRVADLELSMALSMRIFDRPENRGFYSDLRGFDFESPLLSELLDWQRRWVPLKGPRARSAFVLPEGWSQAWWVGVIEMGVVPFGPARSFRDPALAWQWLDAPPHVSMAVEELTSRFHGDSRLRATLTAHLRADPTLDIDAAAHRLGLSTRSLQRALSALGQSYIALRDQVRADIAVSRLERTDEKVDAVAAEIGFRSRSHFVSWFRRMVGQTPEQFRRLRRSVKV